MKVFIFAHDGVWLTGYSAVIAETQEEALTMLQAAWNKEGSQATVMPEHTIVIDPTQPQVVEIWNGDY